jgi:hypothetical protein
MDGERGGSSTGVVAVLVIFLIVVIVAVFVGGSIFGTKNVEINVHTPSAPTSK